MPGALLGASDPEMGKAERALSCPGELMDSGSHAKGTVAKETTASDS